MNKLGGRNSGKGTASGCGNILGNGSGEGLGIKKPREFTGLAADCSVFDCFVTEQYAGGSAPAFGFIGCDGKSASMGECRVSFEGYDH